MIDVYIGNYKRIRRSMKNRQQHVRRSFEAALRGEAFARRRQLMREIRKGTPGGARMRRLTFLSRGLGIRTSRRLRADRPLIRLANAITYNVRRDGKDLAVSFGFTSRSPEWAVKRAAQHETGFSRSISDRQRRFIVREGARRVAGTDSGFVTRTPYFLRRTTRRFNTPARPMIGPFWRKYEDDTWRGIRKKFFIKLKGGRF